MFFFFFFWFSKFSLLKFDVFPIPLADFYQFKNFTIGNLIFFFTSTEYFLIGSLTIAYKYFPPPLPSLPIRRDTFSQRTKLMIIFNFFSISKHLNHFNNFFLSFFFFSKSTYLLKVIFLSVEIKGHFSRQKVCLFKYREIEIEINEFVENHFENFSRGRDQQFFFPVVVVRKNYYSIFDRLTQKQKQTQISLISFDSIVILSFVISLQKFLGMIPIWWPNLNR